MTDIVTCDDCGQEWPMDSDDVQCSPDGHWFCTNYDDCTDRSLT